jgi:hypothetical protein
VKTSARAANIRGILADDEDIRRTVVEMIGTMRCIDQEDIRGFRRAALLDPSVPEYLTTSKARPFKLDDDHYQLLRTQIEGTVPGAHIPEGAHSVEEISSHGVSYATCFSPASRNSAIIFDSCNPDGVDTHRAGKVTKIFHHTHRTPDGQNVSCCYVIVQEHVPMLPNHGRTDPYKKFGFAGGYLCQREATCVHLIKVSQVLCHFALTPFSLEGYEDLIHVLPLDRVSQAISDG